MFEGHRKRVRMLEGIMAVGLLVLVGLLIHVQRHPFDVWLDIGEMNASGMQWEGDHWGMEAEAAAGQQLLSGPYLLLRAGSYTLTVEYESDMPVECRVYSDGRNAYVHANAFELIPGRHRQVYHFDVADTLQDVGVRFTAAGPGRFSLMNMTMLENTRNVRLMIAVLLLLWLGAELFFRLPRKRYAMLLVLTLLGCLPLGMDGLGMGDDFGFHLGRIEALAQGIGQGVFPVRMAGFFNDGAGYPTGVYYGDLFLILPALLRLAGFSVVSAYKVYLLVLTFVTAFAAYACCRRIFGDDRIGIVCSASYVLGPYRLADVYVRSAVGEATAFAFYPLIALAAWNLLTRPEKEKGKNSALLAAGLLGLLYTHLLSTEMAVLALLAVGLCHFRRMLQRDALLQLGMAAAGFLVAGAAFLVPFLDYYLKVDTVVRGEMSFPHMIQKYGVYPGELFCFFKSVAGGASAYLPERMQMTPGMLQMGGLALALVLWGKGKADRTIRKLTVASLLALWVSSSVFPWDALAGHSRIGQFLAQVQFPTRYLGIAMVFLMLLLGASLRQGLRCGMLSMKACGAAALCLSLVTACGFVSSFSEIRSQSRFLDTPELPQYTYHYSLRRGIGGSEYLMSGTDIARLRPEIETDGAEVRVLEEAGVRMVLEASSREAGSVTLPRFAYPYMQVTGPEGTPLPTQEADNHRIRVLLPAGFSGTLKVDFHEPVAWRIAEAVSVLGAAAAVLCLGRRRHSGGKAS